MLFLIIFPILDIGPNQNYTLEGVPLLVHGQQCPLDIRVLVVENFHLGQKEKKRETIFWCELNLLREKKKLVPLHKRTENNFPRNFEIRNFRENFENEMICERLCSRNFPIFLSVLFFFFLCIFLRWYIILPK